MNKKEKKTSGALHKNKIPLRYRLSFSSMVFVLIILMALLTAISALSYHKYVKRVLEEMEDDLENTCLAMLETYPPEEAVKWNLDLEDEEYSKYIDSVQDALAVAMGSAVSIYITDEECKNYYNLYDLAYPGYKYRDAEDQGVILTFDEDTHEYIKMMAESAKAESFCLYYDESAGKKTSKKVITATVGCYVTDEDGNDKYVFYEAENPIADIYYNANSFMWSTIVTFFAIGLAGAVLWIAFLSLKITRPMSIVMDEAERFARERTVPKKTLTEKLKAKSEIGVLAMSIDGMERDLVHNVDALLRATTEKQRLNTELSLASDIQQGTLPAVSGSDAEFPDIDLYAIMDPAREVGGDFYDFFRLDEQHLVLVIADVSDKGIAAALFMMLSQLVLEMQCKNNMDPGQILTNMNEEICKRNNTSNFVTVWLGILDFSTGILTAANAGHEHPFFAEDNKDYEIYKDKHGLVIGAMEGVRYRTYTVNLGAGSSIFVYTDGLPEAINDKEEQFGTDRILQALNEVKDASARDTICHVKQKMQEFVGEEEQFDDTTMLCVKLKK